MTATVGRALGVDLGTKRIGLATCDARRTLASPLKVLARSGDRRVDHNGIVTVALEEEASVIVVGMPVDLRGQAGPAATAASDEVEALRRVSPVPVEMYDERMTTALAAKALISQGVAAKQRRAAIDKFAAAVILQGWIDAQSNDAIEETK